MGSESGDEEKLEPQPGRDLGSDENQRAETKRKDPIQVAQKRPLCRSVTSGRGGTSGSGGTSLLVCLSAFSPHECKDQPLG